MEEQEKRKERQKNTEMIMIHERDRLREQVRAWNLKKAQHEAGQLQFAPSKRVQYPEPNPLAELEQIQEELNKLTGIVEEAYPSSMTAGPRNQNTGPMPKI